MKIKILYFGMIAECLNRSEEEIQLDEIQTVSNLHVYFTERYPQLVKMSFRVAVDGEFRDSLPTTKCESIALLPPFAGG